ncbi:MAG: cysteine hydrolase [Rhodospirillaceae bacterium]|nr:cysteine hydrolase [Rhodospirillaceae bacterium]
MTDAKIDSPATLPGWHMPWPSFEIDWKKAALVVIDMQNYGCNPDAGVAQMLSLRYPEIAGYYVPRLTETAIPNAKKLLTAFRRAGRQVLFTRHGPLMPDGRDMIARRRRRDTDSVTTTNTPTLWSKGSFEHEIIEALKPEANEMVIDKNTSSAFNSTGIEWMLRNMGIETLVVAGMATDMCVETTSRDAADRGFNVIIAEDASATFFPDHHRAALSGFARVFGQVWSSGDVISALQR